MNEELNEFLASLFEETHISLSEYSTPEMAFTASVLDRIEELLDCQEIEKEHCRLTKVNGDTTGEIHAYSTSNNGEVLYLFYTYYNPHNELVSKNNTDGQICLNRMQGFYNLAIRGCHYDLDESTPEYRATKYIYENNTKFRTIKLIVLSNYIIKNLAIKKTKIAAKPVYTDIWDLKKIYGNTHSLSDHIAIDIDFDSEAFKHYKIPFIQMESTQYGYKCVQAMFPAKLLYQLYEQYNTNLLYNNVRYFLGLKGTKEKQPNVAMLDTLRRENEMFLAYNNGITALATDISSTIIKDKEDITDPECKNSSQYITMGILKKISDFRIINGGQTTAAIFNAKNLNESTNDSTKKVNLLGVYVQVKLIISDEIEKISGKITLSSNFQNKVKYSDFSVSNEFNTKMEKLSRSIITPNANNDPTHWFYDRLRGQYDEERKKCKIKADKDYFDFSFPKEKKFSKEDVAKVWLMWQQEPYDSVKGASTTYGSFMKKIINDNFIPDETFYKKTIALLIIYKFLLKRPENKNYANGKATVIAYAISMLEYQTCDKFDLLKVWESQTLSDNTKSYLNEICNNIYNILNEKATSSNTTILSYGKTKGAYDYLKSQNLKFDLDCI